MRLIIVTLVMVSDTGVTFTVTRIERGLQIVFLDETVKK